jgi:hypothetical protein
MDHSRQRRWWVTMSGTSIVQVRLRAERLYFILSECLTVMVIDKLLVYDIQLTTNLRHHRNATTAEETSNRQQKTYPF